MEICTLSDSDFDTGATTEWGANATTDDSARKWWALIAIAASVLAVGLDLTVLNPASAHASPLTCTPRPATCSGSSDAYSLVLAAAMLPAGLLGDRFGRKKVMLAALVLFGASSAACAYATGVGELDRGPRRARPRRGGHLPAVPLAVIPVLFRPRGTAEGDRADGVGDLHQPSRLGPIVGGYLLDHFWWGSVFLINVPVVLVALVAVAVLLPESRSEQRPRRGRRRASRASSAGLAGLTYGLIRGQSGRLDRTAEALAAIGAGLVVLGVFVAWERWLTGRAGGVRPLIELGLFRSAGFTWGTVLGHAGLVRDVRASSSPCRSTSRKLQGAERLGSSVRLLPMASAPWSSA